MTKPIDANGRPLVSTPEEDPAIAADEAARAAFEAQKKAAAERKGDCTDIPYVCAPKDKSADGTNYADLKMKPTPSRAELQSEANTLSDKLQKNPVPYVGKKEDEARLAELQKKLESMPAPPKHVIPMTSSTTRAESSSGWNVDFDAQTGIDGLSVYADRSPITYERSGAKVEMWELSGQIGVSTDLKMTAARATFTDDDGSNVVVQGPDTRFTQGIGKNDDGSVGYHAGAEVNVASMTATKQFENGGSVTVGASDGIGVGATVGRKDTKDGGTAACASVSAAFFTVGACIPLGRM
jgi:hypothetical protein